MITLFQKIYNFRANDFTENENVKIKIGNLVSFLGVLISTFYSFIYLIYMESFLAFFINQCFGFLYLIYFYFLLKDNLLKARLSFFIVFLIHMFIIVVFFASTKSGFHYYYLLTVPGCFLLFNENKKYLKLGIPIISMILLILCHLLGNNYHEFNLSEPIFDVIHLSTIISAFGILIIVMGAFQEELRKKGDRLEYLSKMDPLTEIYNRRAFYTYAKDMIKFSRRYKNKLSLVIFDIDFFKNINDTYGHDTGDLVLKELSKKISSTVRETDCFARFGGEEFILLLPEINNKDILMFADKLKNVVENISVKSSENEDIKITVSIGVTSYKENDTLESIIKRADIAMYEAKRAGRNKVCSLF